MKQNKFPIRTLISSFCLVACCLLFISTANADDPAALTPSEKQKIKEWVQTIKVEDGVGQLFMINIPIHFSKTQDLNPVHKRLIEDEGFGSIILQSSNFNYLKKRAETEEERISVVTNFVSNMQYRALAGKHLKTPLFIAADFEGPRFNPIKSVLTPPPPALTLATTQDIDLIGDTGKVVGYQLASSGINMILGPVLDIEESLQGSYNSLLKNRSFSSSPEGVSRIAAYYIKGLRESGITVIGKHFPGLGKVDINPHAGVARFIGTEQDFKQQITPYYALKDYLNGIMTSHVAIEFLDGKTPATTSKKITGLIRSDSTITNIRSLDYDDKLVITDDMGMGSITDYEKSRSTDTTANNDYYSGIDYAALAIDAFDSGHDILMFAKVILASEKPKYIGASRSGVITVDEIIRVKKRLSSYIRNGNKKSFRKSLNRILQAKAYHYKLHGGNIDNFIKGRMKKVINSRVVPPSIIKSDDGYTDIKKIENLHRKTIIKSYVLLQGSAPNITRLNQKSSCFFTGHRKNYKALKTKYNRIHISKSAHKKEAPKENENISDYLKRIQQPIKDFLENNKCKQIYFEINKKEDVDRLENIIHFTQNQTVSIYVLLHQTPVIISNLISNSDNISIMGAFTTHELSYPIDIQVINGNITPRKNVALTIQYQQKATSINIQKPEAGEPVFDYETDHAKAITKDLIILELEEDNEKLTKNFDKFQSSVERIPDNLQNSLGVAFKDKNITIRRLVPPSIDQIKHYNEIINLERLKGKKNINELLKIINDDINTRDLSVLDKVRYKLLALLSIQQENAGFFDVDVYKNNHGYYTHLLLFLISITVLLILLYIIEFTKRDVLNSSSLKSAVFVLIKRLFTRPQLLIIMVLLASMITLFVARIKHLPISELINVF